jgi:hypothetical protein
MRAASMTAVTGGTASTDSLAASGGLNVPGNETGHQVTVPRESAVYEPIPGERDSTTLTHREVGAMGTYTGAELPPSAPGASVDEEIEHDRILEGGGEGQHHHHSKDHAKGRD